MQDYQYNNFGGNRRLTSLYRKLNNCDHTLAFWMVNGPLLLQAHSQFCSDSNWLESPLDYPLKQFESKHFRDQDVAQHNPSICKNLLNL